DKTDKLADRFEPICGTTVESRPKRGGQKTPAKQGKSAKK
ncbi:unnamed protein product, partial [marine sediment metagenome]